MQYPQDHKNQCLVMSRQSVCGTAHKADRNNQTAPLTMRPPRRQPSPHICKLFKGTPHAFLVRVVRLPRCSATQGCSCTQMLTTQAVTKH